MATQQTLEVLNDAHQALLRSDFDADPRRYVRATNRLFDACLEAGMSQDEPNHELWAAERVTRWLVGA